MVHVRVLLASVWARTMTMPGPTTQHKRLGCPHGSVPKARAPGKRTAIKPHNDRNRRTTRFPYAQKPRFSPILCCACPPPSRSLTRTATPARSPPQRAPTTMHCGISMEYYTARIRSPHEGWRSYAISSARLAINFYKWPLHYMPHQHAKPRRRQARFRSLLSMSRWEIGVAERLFPRGLFAEQRRHSRSCYEPQARDQARKKIITFIAWKQAASQIPFTISNEIGVYRHQLTHERYNVD